MAGVVVAGLSPGLQLERYLNVGSDSSSTHHYTTHSSLAVRTEDVEPQ